MSLAVENILGIIDRDGEEELMLDLSSFYREVVTVVATNEWKSLHLRLSVMVGSEVPPFL